MDGGEGDAPLPQELQKRIEPGHLFADTGFIRFIRCSQMSKNTCYF